MNTCLPHIALFFCWCLQGRIHNEALIMWSTWFFDQITRLCLCGRLSNIDHRYPSVWLKKLHRHFTILKKCQYNDPFYALQVSRISVSFNALLKGHIKSYLTVIGWVIVNWTRRNKLQWNFNQNRKLFIHKNASGNIVCEKAAILSRGRWVKSMSNVYIHIIIISIFCYFPSLYIPLCN